MATALSATLLGIIRQVKLLDDWQLDQADQLAAQFADGAKLGRELVRLGWLTDWQAKQIAAGRAQALTLSGYVLLDLLGQGNMGRVYKARQQRLKRLVALKVIHPACLQDPNAVQRFHREAEAAARLNHPNIIQIFDANEGPGRHFLAMEYVEGVDLAKWMQQSGALPIGQACEFIHQVATGLQHAHEQGLVHRDIKPSNLMVVPPRPGSSGPGTVKILDLGLARVARSAAGDQSALTLTLVGSAMGTPMYLAPEQAMDAHAADIRADIYSLGCTLYHLLAGQPPFKADSLPQMIAMHFMQEPASLETVRSDMPPELWPVVRTMMAKKPAERYQTPDEVAKLLEPWAKSRAATQQLQQSPSVPSAAKGTDPRAFASLPAQSLPPNAETRMEATNTVHSGKPAPSRPVSQRSPIKRPAPARRRSRLVPLLAAMLFLVGGGVALFAALAPERFRQAIQSVQALAGRRTASGTSPQPSNPVSDSGAAIQAERTRLVQTCLEKAKELYLLHQYDGMIAECDKALQADPGAALAHVRRAEAWTVKKDYDQAIQECDRALQIQPDFPLAKAVRAYAYADKKENAKAITEANAAVDAGGRMLSEVLLYRARIYLALKDSDSAIRDLDEAIRDDPKSARAWNNRGYAHRLKKEYDRAIQDLDEAIRLYPKHVTAFGHRGLAFLDKKEYDRAIQDFDEAIRLAPQFAQAFFGRGLAFSSKREYDRAIQDYNEAIRLNPNQTGAFNIHGYAYANKKEYDRAIQDYNEAIRLDPKNATAFANRANAHEKLGHAEQANDDREQAKRLREQ